MCNRRPYQCLNRLDSNIMTITTTFQNSIHYITRESHTVSPKFSSQNSLNLPYAKIATPPLQPNMKKLQIPNIGEHSRICRMVCHTTILTTYNWEGIHMDNIANPFEQYYTPPPNVYPYVHAVNSLGNHLISHLTCGQQ